MYPSPDIIRLVKSMRMRCVGHLARMGEMRNVYTILVRKPERKRISGDLSVYGRVLLERILRK